MAQRQIQPPPVNVSRLTASRRPQIETSTTTVNTTVAPLTQLPYYTSPGAGISLSDTSLGTTPSGFGIYLQESGNKSIRLDSSGGISLNTPSGGVGISLNSPSGGISLTNTAPLSNISLTDTNGAGIVIHENSANYATNGILIENTGPNISALGSKLYGIKLLNTQQIHGGDVGFNSSAGISIINTGQGHSSPSWDGVYIGDFPPSNSNTSSITIQSNPAAVGLAGEITINAGSASNTAFKPAQPTGPTGSTSGIITINALFGQGGVNVAGGAGVNINGGTGSMFIGDFLAPFASGNEFSTSIDDGVNIGIGCGNAYFAYPGFGPTTPATNPATFIGAAGAAISIGTYIYGNTTNTPFTGNYIQIGSGLQAGSMSIAPDTHFVGITGDTISIGQYINCGNITLFASSQFGAGNITIEVGHPTTLSNTQGTITVGNGGSFGFGNDVKLGLAFDHIGFFGVSPVGQQSHPTTLSDVITLLTNLGLCS